MTGRPAAVEVDGVRDEDSLEAVVQRGGCGPHLREHAVALEAALAVHSDEQFAGDSRRGDDCGASWWHALFLVVACHVVAQQPGRALGVVERIEND